MRAILESVAAIYNMPQCRRITGNSVEKFEIFEKIRLDGSPRFDLNRNDLATFFHQKVNFIAAIIAPIITLRADSPMEILL